MSFKVWLSEPMPHQIPILADPARFKVLVCGRRWGKTDVLMKAAIDGHGPDRSSWKGALRGGKVWWVLPTFKGTLAREIWDALVEALREVTIWKSETERAIKLPGGGSITMKSSDNPDSCRGVGVDLILLDEVKDHTLEVWKECLRPALADKRGSAILAGTPPRERNSDNLCTHVFTFAENHDGWARWQLPSSDNPLMTEDELASALEESGTYVFGREYLAKFTTPGGGKFEEAWFRHYDRRDGRVWLDDESFRYDELRCFATCDLAASKKSYSDHAVISSWGQVPDGRLLLLHVLRDKFVGAKTIAHMKEAVEKWDLVRLYVESTVYHTDLIDIAKAEKLPIRELDADTDKVTRAELALAYMERGKIWIPRAAPWLKTWKDEVLDFEGAPGEEDDQVDTLSYAAHVAFRPRRTLADGVTQEKKRPSIPPLGVKSLPSLRRPETSSGRRTS